MTSRVTVVVVDDDAIVRLGIKLLCDTAPGIQVIGEASDGAQALRVLESSRPDVLLMDVQMRIGGIETALTVHHKHPGIRVVLMSAFVGEDFRQHALNVGAAAFVAKTAAPALILDAINPGAATASTPGAADVPRSKTLSARETEIAQKVADGWGNEQIADVLFLSPNTVKTYVSRVFRKLHVDNRVQLANLLNHDRPTGEVRADA